MSRNHPAGSRRAPSGARFAGRCALAGALAVGGLLGCGDAAVAPARLSDALPALESLDPVAGVEGLSVRSRIALGGDGSWLYAAPRLTNSALVLVDSTGATRPIGGVGEGPGEARFAVPMRLSGDSVVGFDMATLRLIVWDRGGRVRDARRAGTDGLPLFWPAGDHLLGVRNGPGGKVPLLLDPLAGEASAPVATTDSLYRALFGAGDDPEPEVAEVPVVGTWRDGVVIGDGRRFTFGLYDSGGRLRHVARLDLPPRRRSDAEVERVLSAARDAGMITGGAAGVDAERRRLAADPVPWVSAASHPRSDTAGRLWILRGADDASVAAELFRGARHLGTLTLPCPGFSGEWAMAPGLVAVVCAPTDSLSPDDAVLRRYRIVEPTGSGRQ